MHFIDILISLNGTLRHLMNNNTCHKILHLSQRRNIALEINFSRHYYSSLHICELYYV